VQILTGAWEAVQYLIRALDTHSEQGAALLLSLLGGLGAGRFGI